MLYSQTVQTQNILSDYYNGSVQIASPRIGLSNTNINFGDVDITENPTSSIQIRNYGNDTLKIHSANLSQMILLGILMSLLTYLIMNQLMEYLFLNHQKMDLFHQNLK